MSPEHGATMNPDVRPDLQGWTIWETIANTINDDDLTVYMILDGAHRGFNTRTTSDKRTIVSRLVNGHAGYPAIPIVWGISATIDRFKQAMAEAEAVVSRRALPPIQVDPARVQESGLVKDTIVFDILAEAGNFDTVLVRRAADKLRDASARWERYATTQSSQRWCGRCWCSRRRTRPIPIRSRVLSTRSCASSRT
jgi:type III restriction enzyme